MYRNAVSPLRAALCSCARWLLVLGALLVWEDVAKANILWTDLGATLAHDTGPGSDILGGALKRDSSSSDTLYFKFHVDPLSDASTEEYFAAFELYEGGEERLGVGNALKAWAYSAYKADGVGEANQVTSYVDLNSSRPEPSGPGAFFTYEHPHRGLEVTIIFKVQYVPGGDDLVTVWLNPDLGPGATEAAQPESLITRFSANTTFDEIHLRHGGGGGGWIFSDMEIATSFSDFVKPAGVAAGGAAPGVGSSGLPFAFRSWQREQGLPQNFVRALAQTRDGYIWIGSDDGVSRFDGVQFVSFGLPEGLRSGPVRTLFGDTFGALWIGSTGGGLTRWQDGQFTTFTMQDGLPTDSITTLAEDGGGRLWVGTDAGLVLWREGRPMSLGMIEQFKGKAITSLFKDSKGTMWVGAAGTGVFYFQDGKFFQVKDASVGDLLQNPHCLLVGRDGRVWVGAGDDFVLCREGNQWRPYRIPHHQAKSYISSLAEAPDGTIWAGSVGEGLFEFKSGKIQAINASSGLSDNLAESLLVDREGVLWVGTHGGLNQLRVKNLFTFGQREGLGYGAVQGMAEIAPGVIWAGKPSDGLYLWNGGDFSHLAAAGLSLGGPQVNSMLVARDGSCWVAAAHGLLHFKDPASAANEAELFELPKLNVVSLAEDHVGGIWAGTREGELWRRGVDGAWQAQSNHWQSHAITAIVQDRDGWMWIGTDGGGLDRFKDLERMHWDKANGLMSDLIRTLYLDPEDTLWIGTAGGGLSRLQDGQIATFTTREGLPDNTVSQILPDDGGNLWLGGNRGIVCVSKRDLDDLTAHKIPAVYPRVYGRAEGMLSEECTGGFFPAGLKTKSGLLWFSTLKGIVVADPHRQLASAPAPAVVLEEALVDGVPGPDFRASMPASRAGSGTAGESPDERMRISPGRHRIEFHYTGLSFDAPERVRFRYKLEGLDADWVEAGTRRVAFYSYVPPGNYRFRVIACNGNGVWNETGANLPLRVLPHFWQTWWVIGLAGVGMLVAVGGGARLAEKRKVQRWLRQLEQERMLERERTRIAQDLHDEMGAKLCRISFLSEHARRGMEAPSELREQIVSISDASREVLRSLDEIVWAVNPQNDTLEHVASYIGQYADDYFEMTGIKCGLAIPAELPPHPLSSQMRHHLFLAVHEALTNILKHSGAKRAGVSLTCKASTLEITVTDDGGGFDPSAIEPNSEDSGSPGNGLRNMHTRLQDMGGHCKVQSERGRGTIVRFVLPMNGELKRK